MATKIGINGFGRIGRLVLRTINQYHRNELEVVAVNDLANIKTNAHLLKWDSNYGQYSGNIEVAGDAIMVDGRKITVIAEKDPSKIQWKNLGADIVIESTGFFTDATKAAGQWNHVRLLISSTRCEHAINGVKYFDYVLGSADFNARVAKSKFATWPKFAKYKIGHIALQGDHGDISFANIKLRPLPAK